MKSRENIAHGIGNFELLCVLALGLTRQDQSVNDRAGAHQMLILPRTGKNYCL